TTVRRATVNRMVRGIDDRLYSTYFPQFPRFSGASGVIRFDPRTNDVTSLHAFTPDTDGTSPIGALTGGQDGLLYGTTYLGGATDNGTIYTVDPATGAFAVVFSFDEGQGSKPLVQTPDGSWYGSVAPNGGDCGWIFRFDPATATAPIVKSLDPDVDGCITRGMTVAADGNLYGITAVGGTASSGTIFKIDATGAFSVVANLDSNPASTLT